MIIYFVSRNALGGLAAGNFKSINSAANNLFEGGHVQNIEIGESKHHIYIKSDCLPEGCKDRVYKIQENCIFTTASSSSNLSTALKDHIHTVLVKGVICCNHS